MIKFHSNQNLVRRLLGIHCFLLIFASLLCGQESRPSETPESEPALTQQQKRLKAFEIVWQTVNESFYDRNFGGVDWYQLRKRYEPLATAARTDEQLYLLLQQMLNELHQSHFFVIPPDSIPRFVSPPKSAKLRKDGNSVDEESEEDDEENTELDLSALLDKGNPELTERLSTGIGIDLRIINRDVIITRVEPGSSAARAGLRPGFIIKKAGYTSLDDAIARLYGNPICSKVLRSERC
jgi:C-terminal processing protease CtpA/Prc